LIYHLNILFQVIIIELYVENRFQFQNSTSLTYTPISSNGPAKKSKTPIIIIDDTVILEKWRNYFSYQYLCTSIAKYPLVSLLMGQNVIFSSLKIQETRFTYLFSIFWILIVSFIYIYIYIIKFDKLDKDTIFSLKNFEGNVCVNCECYNSSCFLNCNIHFSYFIFVCVFYFT